MERYPLRHNGMLCPPAMYARVHDPGPEEK